MNQERKAGEPSALIWLWLTVFVIAFDLITKQLAENFLTYGQPVPIFPVFDLQYASIWPTAISTPPPLVLSHTPVSVVRSIADAAQDEGLDGEVCSRARADQDVQDRDLVAAPQALLRQVA